jgi:hypothetical protein
MSSFRFFKMAHGLLLTNFILALLALVSNTKSLFDRMINGYGIPGLEKLPMWKVHLGNFAGISQLIVVMYVYHLSRKAIGVFVNEGRMTDATLLLIDKLIKSLLVLAIMKIVIHFFFPEHYYGTFFDHFINSNFMSRQFDRLEMIIYLTHAVTFISNIVGLFTFFLNPANCLFFIVVLKGIQKFYQENKSLKSELESVI